ncbi:NAD(P)/FAD-dependent oxidoreductase [Pandoraea sp. ISTKB]|uniref:NAD(P)/FAD-dependent oxidoreductase n=1 Tax=Pandoraea sp. ISTKB TaxID=1586708 RepID=UPI000A9CA6D2|nr:FAD-dependent oxidoreductase [Pandoraea sp. ISTKB]
MTRIEADVIVVGGGPSGIAAAVAMKQRGVGRVVIIEREPVLGGVPRHCGHPPFGMREFGRVMTGPRYAERLARYAIEHGVEILTRTTVVALEQDGVLRIASHSGQGVARASRVVLATGVREMPRSARLISGDRPLGVVNTGALQAYVYLQGLTPFRRPVIVGTELVALSALLTCRKAGIRPTAMLEENCRPTTYRAFMGLPRMLGVPVHYASRIEAIHGSHRVDAVTVRQEDGKVRTLACDGVLFTGRFTPESTLVRTSHLELDDGTQGPQIDQFGRCTDSTYYAAGNLLRPVETAGWSFREGRRIGHCVADDLLGIMPRAQHVVKIERTEGIKLVVPQRISLPSTAQGLAQLQVRVTRQARGSLNVNNGRSTLWQSRKHLLPERRVLIPMPQIALEDDLDALSVGIQSASADAPFSRG